MILVMYCEVEQHTSKYQHTGYVAMPYDPADGLQKSEVIVQLSKSKIS